MIILSTKSVTDTKKPQGKFDFPMRLFLSKLLNSLPLWRRDRDSNPRWATNPRWFSRTSAGIRALYKSISYILRFSKINDKTHSNTLIFNQVRPKGGTVIWGAE